MKATVALLALLLGVVLGLPSSALAQKEIFQGAGLADGLALSPGATNATQTSQVFTVSDAANRKGILKINVTVCTACNITLTVVVTDPDGTEWTWDAPTPLTTTGTVRYLWGLRLIAATPLYDVLVANMTGPPIAIAKPFPPNFKLRVTFNSGTTATYTVTGEAW